MTKEEAKKALEEDLPKVSQFSPKMASAYKVAISALKGFEGMTNGEVMKAVFPNLFLDFCVCDSVFLHSKEGSHLEDLVGRLERDWWDSPYKKGE